MKRGSVLERYVSRSELGWPATEANTSNTDLGMIAHYDSEDENVYEKDHETPKAHSACISYWKRTRDFHVKGHGWADVGYAYMVCPHDYILAGREFGHVQAAELPTPGKLQNGNTRYVAVTFATGPHEHPNALQLQAWSRLRAHLRSRGMSTLVLGHRDFTSTDCPGDIIYRMVKDGRLLGNPTVEPGAFDVSALPTLSLGKTGYDVLTLRSLLFQRFLASRYETADGAQLFNWLRSQEFDAVLRTDVMAYQTWAGLDSDGVVGPKTWAKLLRMG